MIWNGFTIFILILRYFTFQFNSKSSHSNSIPRVPIPIEFQEFMFQFPNYLQRIAIVFWKEGISAVQSGSWIAMTQQFFYMAMILLLFPPCHIFIFFGKFEIWLC